MKAIAATSNPNAQVPGSALGTTTPSTSPTLGPDYKLSVRAVVNAYGQTVLNPGIGSALATLTSTILTPPPGVKAPAPTPPKPPAPAAAPSGSGSGSPAGGTADS